METLLNLSSKKSGFLTTFLVMLFLGGTNFLSASPLDWMFYFEDNDHHGVEITESAPPALSCKTYVNVSLGIDGYAVLTSITLVNGPTFPWLYEVDIMGPLNDTVFCEQIGQEVMVVVTEIASGNSCMSTVFVEDKLRPVLTCTPDTLPCNVDIPSIDFEDYLDIVTDNCDDDLDVWYSYVVQNLPCNPHHFTQQILVTWTATDDSGNSATCQDIIYLERPSINLIDFPADVTVSCLDPNIDPSVTGEPTYEGEPLGYACQYVIFHSDQIVPMCDGAQKILRLWTIMDWCNSAQRTDVQEILIIDNVPPVITCPINVTINANLVDCTAKYTFPTPVVVDACAPASMIEIEFTVSGVPGIFSPGDMVFLGLGNKVITVRATDPCQNTSQCQYMVTVRDNTPPVPICHSITIGVGADGMATIFADLLDFNIVENCGILNTQIWRMTTNCAEPGDLVPGPDVKFCCEDIGETVLVVFKVTDLSGNMNTCMFQVTVIDELPPVADCEDITISITNQGTIVVNPELILGNTSDNCFIVDTFLLPGTFDCDDIGENQVILTITDQSGNASTCSATVTIVDEVPPVALCRDITVTVNSNGDAEIITSQINNGSSDNCAIDTMYLDQYEFDCDDAPSEVVVLTVVDESGNSSTCSATVTILTSPPTALCQDITVYLDDLGTVTINADQIDNGSFDDCGIDTITVTPTTFTCADTGENVVVLTVTDISGNVSTCSAVVTVQDTTSPIANCQDISIMLDENGMAVISPEQINDGSTDNCDSITISLDITMFDCEDAGPNIVTLTVTDAAGNTSTCTANVMVMMPEPPTALCEDITVTLGPDGIVTIDADDIDNGSTAQCGGLMLEINIDTFDCEDVGEINIVILTVTDETGATATCTATVTVLENPPVANCENITVSLDANGNITITAGQVEDGSTDDCGIDTITVTPFAFDCEDLGPNQVVVTVTDFSGLSATCTAIVTVEDNMPPVAICQDITVNLDAMGNATISATQIDNNSSDNCDTITLSVTPNTFDCTDVGEVNIVTLTVTDGSGNTSTCTATVTVESLPPAAVCVDITVNLGPDGMVIIEAADVDGGSISNCGAIDLSISENTFDCTEQGDNIVILTVTDGAGNTSTCTATVTVTDNIAPLCVADDLTVFLNADGEVSITAAQIDGGSTDNCDTINISVTPVDFTCEDLGDNVVTLTVSDNSGNSSTCTAIVTVVDSIPPVAICQDITVSIDGTGMATVTATQIDNGSTDNCDTITLSITPDTFDCDDVGEVNIITLTVTDGSGNTSSCTATVTVVGLPPSAQCVDITVSLGPDGTIVVDASEVDGGSGSNCAGDLDLSLSEDTFDCTEQGDNIVILTVTDGAGNTSTCTATITVVDDTDPICEADDLTVTLDPEGNVSITASQIDGGSTDNCDTITVSVTPEDFTCEDVGENVVVLTVTDNSGNSSTCTATVTVVDDIDPICNAQDITVSVNGSGIVTITPEEVNDGSSDNCGPVTLDVEPATFDCDDVGEIIIVTLTVTDASGNTSTCTASVTVTESGSLEAVCQNVTIVLDANGMASIDPDQINNGSGGGCESDSITFELSQTNFDCTDIGPNIVTLTVMDTDGNTATCTAIVTVEDNTPPVIDCPDNLTVQCDEVTNPQNTAQFGSATATDNCGIPNINENATFNLNNCNIGTITRVFTATDGDGNTASCIQIVTITNGNPFTEDDITWPPSPVNVNICNSTAPGSIPNGTPTFDPTALNCANPIATFSDAVQMIVDNNPATPCRIITRTWTVTDDCQPGISFVFVQTINVVDMVAPVFTNIPNMMKNADANCQAFFTLIASATDCAGVTITNNSPYGATTGANASGNYPIGETVVIFTATDGCGNISTMDVVITVVDTDPAEFLCEKVIVILDPEDLEIEIAAHTFLMILSGGCTDPDDFIISYSSTNPFDTVRIFDCNDVGVTTFPLWFWNATGSFKVDSCNTADLDLRDPDDNCGDGLVLQGNIHHEDGWAVEGAEVMITNANMQPVVTNDDGNFTITGLEVGEAYNIAPFNDTLHKEGVSTLDLVLIQKHILGRAKLNTPYKLIAADANNSGHISAVDLLEIRKLILGVSARYAHNTSWRFVDRNFAFPDPYNPFSTPFAESMWFDSVALTTGSADFIGVKIGDINASYFLAGINGQHLEGRNDSRYILELSREKKGADVSRHASIMVRQGAVDIDGIQFSLYVGSLSAPQLAAIQSDVLEADNWFYNREEGLIHISWTTAEAQDLSGKVLLSWPEHDALAYDIHLADQIDPEAYIYSDKGVEVRHVNLVPAETEMSPASEYHLYQNQPNPFADGTVIGYQLAQDDDIRLVVFDLTGRLIYEHKASQKAGYHEVSIDGHLLKTAGIYYYTLYAGNTTLTRKMTYTN